MKSDRSAPMFSELPGKKAVNQSIEAMAAVARAANSSDPHRSLDAEIRRNPVGVATLEDLLSRGGTVTITHDRDMGGVKGSVTTTFHLAPAREQA